MAETNARKRPIGFVEASTVETDDFLLIDGQTSGTRKIKPDKVGKANTSDLNNDAGFQNASEVAAAIAANIDDGLNTAGKAADSKAVGDALATMVDAASGKGLATNDYTTAEKTKLAGVATGATRVLIDSGLSESGKAADAAAVGAALETKVTKETGKGLLALDATLTQTGKAADAKVVGDALKADIAPVYSASSTYAVGAYVLYNNVLYRCTTAIATAEAWTAAHWTAVNVGSELTQYKQDNSELHTELGKLEGTTIIKKEEDVTPAEVVPGYVWYRYTETKASYYASSKYGYKKYNVSDLPNTVIITTYTLDTNLQYVFVDADNNILKDGFTAQYRICDVVTVPSGALYLYVNYAQQYITTAFDPYGVKKYTTFAQKEKKEVSPTKTLIPDGTYAGYYLYTSNASEKAVRFNDNSSFTSYYKRVRQGDKIRLKSMYFSSLAGYVLTDLSMKVYFVKHTTSSGSASYDDTITMDRDGYVFYTAYGTSAFYEQDDLINTLGSDTGRLYGKKIFFDGDSITMASGSGVVGYVNQIEAITGCVSQNLAVDGGTITSGTVIPGGTARHHVCESILNSDSDTDIFCISGGYNDWGIGQSAVGTLNPQITSDLTQFDTTTLYGALDYIFTWLMINRPGKPILFIMTHNPLNYRIAGGTNLTANITLEEWFGYIKNACKKYSVPIVNLFDNTPLMTKLDALKVYTVNSDGVHPNTGGYRIYYVPQIMAKLNEICPYDY